jgi:hypothetical protein
MSQNSQSQTLDPGAVNLSKAIRQVESGSKFDAKGKTGEHGAYQFMPATWQNYSKQAGVNVPLEQATPEQQNEVAYKKIKQWKDQGYNPGQIASMWNAGEGKPNAYIEGNKGVNSKGVSFDTAKYAKDVATAYQQLKTQNSSTGVSPQQDSQEKPDERNWLQKGMDFALPIVGDIGALAQGKNEKSGGQLLGDAALSALMFVPGLGEAGLAGRGAGVVGKMLAENAAGKVLPQAAEKLAAAANPGLLAKLGANPVVKGAGVGYGAGVASNLSQGQDIGSAIAPNTNNLLGAATGGLASKIIPKIAGSISKHTSQSGAVSALESNIAENAKKWVGSRNLLAEMPNGGSDAISLVARTPKALPQIENGQFSTKAGQDFIQKQIKSVAEVRNTALDNLGVNASLTKELQTEAEALLNTPEMIANPNREAIAERLHKNISGLTTNHGGDIVNASQLEKIKEVASRKTGAIKSPEDIGADYLLAKAARQILEKKATSANAPGLAELNKLLQSHIHARSLLKSLDGKVVKGGRLGNMLRGHAIGTMATMAGGLGGGGFVGALGAGLAGEVGNSFLSKILGETSFTNPVRDAIIRKMSQENPKILQQWMALAGKEGQVAPQLVPKGKTQGLIPSLLIKGATRAASGLSNSPQ